MKYIYPAFFYEEENGYSVLFPDFSCGTCGATLSEALEMATDFLYVNVVDYLEAKKDLPLPSEITKVKPETDFKYKNAFPSLISVDVKEYKKYLNAKNKAIRKNVTIPEWLAERADTQHLNYSSVLQEALKKELGIA